MSLYCKMKKSTFTHQFWLNVQKFKRNSSMSSSKFI